MVLNRPSCIYGAVKSKVPQRWGLIGAYIFGIPRYSMPVEGIGKNRIFSIVVDRFVVNKGFPSPP